MNGHKISIPAMWWDDIPRATIFMLFFTDVVDIERNQVAM